MSWEGHLSGFFFDNIIRTIELYKSQSDLAENEIMVKKQLVKAHKFLEMVERGEEQVDTGRLQSNAVDSIGAYRRSLSAFMYHHPDDEDFKSYIEKIKNGIDGMLKAEDIDNRRIESIEQFFRLISESTLEETERLP